jgi:hypothetical protein
MSAKPRAGTGMDAKALARARREALRAHTLRIRRSVAALAVAMFVLAFAAVYVQLASGHDPALLAAARRRAAASSAERTGASSERASTQASGSEGSESSSGEASGLKSSESSSETSGAEAASGETPVTTAQS